MLIAEDLLLLLLDDERGTGPSGSELTPVLGGAVLVELALLDAVRVGEKSGFWAAAKVHVATGAAPEDPVLAAALRIVAEKERSAQDLVDRLGKGLREALVTRLAEQGILRRQDRKVLGLFPRTTWPAADVTHELRLRQELTTVLVHGLQPRERTAALIALLWAVGRAHKVVSTEGLSAREVKSRAKAVAEGDWAARAVREAVQAAESAIIAALTLATTAAGG